jgi:hypothetical protein
VLGLVVVGVSIPELAVLAFVVEHVVRTCLYSSGNTRNAIAQYCSSAARMTNTWKISW